jgi:hypothetical protein
MASILAARGVQAAGVALAGAGMILAGTGFVSAQQAGRFTMHPAEGGMIRLDTETGTMSMCKSATGGQWQCQALPDERQALDKEIARLAQENQDLQASVRRLEELAGIPQDKPQRRADKDPGTGPGGMKLPGPEDVDKAMTYMQSMLKKFKEKIKEFEDLESKPGQRL